MELPALSSRDRNRNLPGALLFPVAIPAKLQPHIGEEEAIFE
jgi:hypothetical protein